VTTLTDSSRQLRATGAYLRFELPRTFRNRRYIVLAIGFPVAFYLLFTRVLTGNAPADPGVQAFGMVSMAAYGAIGASLSAAVRISMERTNGWMRQLRVTPLPPLAYLTGKFASAYVTAVPSIVLVMFTAYAVNGVALAPTTWLLVFVALAFGVLPFAALGVAIGFLFDESSAQLVFSIAYVGLAVLGGLWTPISSFPDALATLSRMTPSYRFADLGWAALAGRSPDIVDVLLLAAYGAAFAALVAWRYRAAEERVRG
jgi:ABC-2 type transport system permease protein